MGKHDIAGFLDPKTGKLYADPLAGEPIRPCYDCGRLVSVTPGAVVHLAVSAGDVVFVLCGRCRKLRRVLRPQPAERWAWN